MNKFQKFSAAATAMLLVIVVLFTSCKKDFENPPASQDPAIVANTSLAAFKALHVSSGSYETISTDLIISGVVVADDRSGNLYKTLYIEDSTGGLGISLDANNLFGTYPVGRRVVIKAKGLTLSDYHNTMLLGMKTVIGGIPSVEAIPSGLIGNYIIGGSLNNPVVPHVVTSADLTIPGSQPWLNVNIGRLIQLNNYEFRALDTAATYADTSYYKNSLDRYINLGCAAGTSLDIDVRSSGYSNFASQLTPKGNGTIIGIYAPYNTTKQMIIRDPSDVRFTGTRCGAVAGTQLISENFESQTVNTNIAITGWVNAAEVGGVLYQSKTFSGNKYANITAFGTTQNVVTSWLVTKAINVTGFTTKTLSFNTNQGFTGTGNALAAPLKVMISTNYTGSLTPWTATWTDITPSVSLSPGAATGYPASFTPSGNINLVPFLGANTTFYIAFKYDGADPAGTATDKTSTWEIDDVTVTAN